MVGARLSNSDVQLYSQGWRTQDSDWDAEIAEIGAADLIARASVAINGWSGPAWLRTGWFQAYLLLGELAGNEDLRHRVEPLLQRLKTATYENAVERINLERSLVSTLAGNCRARVAGYTVKREYLSTAFTAGIENIAYELGDGLQLADVHPHREAEGFSLERLARARDRRRAQGRLEPDCGLHRQFRAD